ncbi:2S proteasome subunit beta 7 [Nematocida displodere]|uniref:Proteasome subunit beta n=1 Tax=Nematocida displodere TaxID=1805483 RepID=A0A177EF34_9MICR|nr:2S proteasome subunit beta 7 [Nematocida displodere]
MEELGIYTIQNTPIQVNPKAYTMGTSVLAIKYADGVMVASDTQASYGSYAKYKGIERVAELAPTTLLASSGEYSNFQELKNRLTLEMKAPVGEEPLFGPRECFEILRNHMYSKRCKGAPEINFHIVAGIEKALPREALPYESDPTRRFLAGIDHLGNFFHANVIATGIGAHIALPILRAAVQDRDESITEEEAANILKTAMTTLIYRDTRATSIVQFSRVTQEGVQISAPIKLETDWSVGRPS